MAMYIFTKNILEGKSITVYNEGKMHRDFTYIDDIVDGTCSCFEKFDYQIFNIGNNTSHSLIELISMIEKKLNKKAIINYENIQPGDIKILLQALIMVKIC